MDLQSFIESGLLEAYVLNQCSGEERALVERMIAEHPSVRNELLAIEQSLESYALAHQVPPAPAVRQRIMDAIDRESTMPKAVSNNKTPASMTLRIFQLLSFGLAAACVLLFVNLNGLRTERDQFKEKATTLQTQIEDCNARSESEKHFVKVFSDPDTKKLELVDNPTLTKVAVPAYHNATWSEVIVDINAMPAAQSGRYYQFWAIINDKPVSLGMIDMQAPGGHQSFKIEGQKPVAYAISAEDNPKGNATPTLVILTGKLG